jgi:hypothetical protein
MLGIQTHRDAKGTLEQRIEKPFEHTGLGSSS